MGQSSTREQEYWRPPNPNAARLIDMRSAEVLCWNCGTEFPAAARFCHICGSPRDPSLRPLADRSERNNVPGKLMLSSSGSRPRLPLASLVCFLLGVACCVAAGLMSLLYRTDTLVDWQAVQIWRIEWLLAALVALLAGVLLRKAG